MLKRKALKKIYLTTLVLFIMLIIISFDHLKINKDKNILETEYVSNFKVGHLYLLNEDNYLVKVDVLLKNNTINNISYLLKELSVNNKKFSPLKGFIPSNATINSIVVENRIAKIDFSKDLLKVNKNLEEKVIEGIVYTILELEEISDVQITLDGKQLGKLEKSNKTLPILLNQSFGINKNYEINNMKDIEKVVIYYVCNINNNDYFVPVTKYVNSKDSKIKIIIDSLKGSTHTGTNLSSYLNREMDINFQIDKDVLTLTFDSLNDSNLESVTYSLASSIFDSMDIKKVIFEVDSKIIDIIIKD